LSNPAGPWMFDLADCARAGGSMPDPQAFKLADPALDVVSEASDPRGDDRLEATARDETSGVIATASHTMTLGGS